jgi:tryptophan synthase alpha subunit
MEAIQSTFERKKQEVRRVDAPAASLRCSRTCRPQGAPALVTFVTAGYPSPNDTVSVMLAMEAGGADIIELGVPFSDPVADGVAIQKTNAVCRELVMHRRSRA